MAFSLSEPLKHDLIRCRLSSTTSTSTTTTIASIYSSRITGFRFPIVICTFLLVKLRMVCNSSNNAIKAYKKDTTGSEV
ncbi:hypothetical protein Hanom_Chr01g00063291 [Helianthus anomalus]